MTTVFSEAYLGITLDLTLEAEIVSLFLSHVVSSLNSPKKGRTLKDLVNAVALENGALV
jgi:hypothetical protein